MTIPHEPHGPMTPYFDTTYPYLLNKKIIIQIHVVELFLHKYNAGYSGIGNKNIVCILGHYRLTIWPNV